MRQGATVSRSQTGIGMIESVHQEPEYDEVHMRFLELVWGAGYLSPGGPDEVARVLQGLDLAGKSILDLGCGSGGIALHIAGNYDPASVTGFDVEVPVILRARAAAQAAGLSDRLTFVQAPPGALPFADASFDTVFSKDAMVHVPDKDALFAEIFRVLKPGGMLAASDWLIGHDDPPSEAMRDYLEAEGLSFGMASPARYRQAMEHAGFTGISTLSRNGWYREEAARERARLSGELYDVAVEAVGRAFVDKNIRTWAAMQKVLDSGEHCPTHLRAQKPEVGQ